MTDHRVQLRYATLPGALRAIAIHCWFASRTSESTPWTRWEVWQEANVGGIAHGHVHRDLMDVDAGVGGGPARIAREWRGANATSLIHELSLAHHYPARDRYRAWPGPNSNTFVRWILDRSRLPCPLDARAIGKDFRGLIGLRIPPGEIGIALDTVLGGVALSLSSIELHLLGFTLGMSWRPLALKTMLGDIPMRAVRVRPPSGTPITP